MKCLETFMIQEKEPIWGIGCRCVQPASWYFSYIHSTKFGIM